jgi:hypothetical protein
MDLKQAIRTAQAARAAGASDAAISNILHVFGWDGDPAEVIDLSEDRVIRVGPSVRKQLLCEGFGPEVEVFRVLHMLESMAEVPTSSTIGCRVLLSSDFRREVREALRAADARRGQRCAQKAAVYAARAAEIEQVLERVS